MPLDPGAAQLAAAKLMAAQFAGAQAAALRLAATPLGTAALAAAQATAAQLAGQLRNAFGAHELRAHYQPQYDLSTGSVVALEALCRWQHPLFGLLTPTSFMAVAERFGLIAQIGRFMLEESGRRIVDLRELGIRTGMSINASPTELNARFADTLLERLRDLGIPREVLTVEITESPAISYTPDELTALETLVRGGVGVSIDDFGAGNTSIELVRRLPITEVKIDKSLLHDPSPAVDDLVLECIAVARERHASVVAEGVETREHYERAIRWECDRAQGFYYSPAVPADEVAELFAA